MSWRRRKVDLSTKNAIQAINDHHILLVYPIANKPVPLSLWHVFFPKTKMHWAWDETHDDRVAKMWDLRERTSRLSSVVYTKWYQGRATFFSRGVFTALLAFLHDGQPERPRLGREAHQILEALLENSPQTTKTLKQTAKKEWAWSDKEYDRGMKELWQKLLIVGRGEVDDGAFPSLNVSASELAFGELWQNARKMKPEDWEPQIASAFPEKSPWRKQLDRLIAARGPKKKPGSRTVRFEDLH